MPTKRTMTTRLHCDNAPTINSFANELILEGIDEEDEEIKEWKAMVSNFEKSLSIWDILHVSNIGDFKDLIHVFGGSDAIVLEIDDNGVETDDNSRQFPDFRPEMTGWHPLFTGMRSFSQEEMKAYCSSLEIPKKFRAKIAGDDCGEYETMHGNLESLLITLFHVEPENTNLGNEAELGRELPWRQIYLRNVSFEVWFKECAAKILSESLRFKIGRDVTYYRNKNQQLILIVGDPFDV